MRSGQATGETVDDLNEVTGPQHGGPAAPAPDLDRPQPTGWRQWAGGWPPVLAVVCCAVLTWNRMVFSRDDFPQFRQAQTYGLSWRTASLNVYQHFAPINRLGHWFVQRFSPLNTHVALGIALAFFAWFAIALHLALGELGASRARRAALVVASGLSVPVIDTMSWFDGAMQWLPFLAALTTFVYAHLRYLHHRSVGRAAVAVAALLVCVLTDIRFVLALPLAVLLDTCLITPGGLRPRLRRLRTDFPYYAVVAVLTLGAALVITSRYEIPSTKHVARTRITASIVWESLTSFLPSRLLGHFATHPFPKLIAAGVALVLVLGVVAIVRRNRYNLGPVIVVVVGGVLTYLVLWKSDLLGSGPATNARRSDYMLPALLIVTLAASRVTVYPAGKPARPVRSPAAVAAVVVAAAVLPALWWIHGGVVFSGLLPPFPQSYLQNVRANQAFWTDNRNSLVELHAPHIMVPGGSHKQARTGDLFGLLDRAYTDTPLGAHPYFVDVTGVPRPAALMPVADSLPLPSCGAQAAAGRVIIAFPTPVSRAPLHLLLHLAAPQRVALRISPLLGSMVPDTDYVSIGAGSADWAVLVPGRSFNAVELATVGSAAPCVTSAQAVRVVEPHPDGTCALIGPEGERGAVARCGRLRF